MLASLSDINAHLPEDKLRMEQGNDSKYQTDAERSIKAYLSSVYTQLTLVAWDEPDNTPETIRGIAGRLIAAMYYRERFAGDGDGDPDFAQIKYNEAMSMLMMIRTGQIVLPEVTGDEAVTITSDDFWPNDTTGDPKFTMDQVFG